MINALWNNYHLFESAYNQKGHVFNLKSQLVIYPIKGKIIFEAFFESPLTEKIVTNILLNESNIEEYSFWNNCDMPENMLEIEWNQRELDWKSALLDDFHSIPSLCGLTVDLFNISFIPISSDQIFVGDKNRLELSQRINMLYDILKPCFDLSETKLKERIIESIKDNTYLDMRWKV